MTTFGRETAFKDIKFGDTILLYDGEDDVMVKGEVMKLEHGHLQVSGDEWGLMRMETVSYTHLTLPTTPYV